MVSAPTAFNIATAITPCAYITLTVISLCSLFIPWLNSLASHGKTRQSNPTLVLNDRNMSLIELLNHKCLLVAKRRFIDFYAFGLIWSAFVLGFRLDLTSTVIYCHFIRRYYECRYIHQWRNAKMHVAGYILGYIHYILLPFIFVPDTPKNVSFCLGVIAVGVNFMAQREQFLHHRILAKCRTEDHTKEYKIPCGRLFAYVCCPHYTAEILIYFTFLVLGYRGSGEYEFEKSFDNTENIIAIDFLNQCGRFIPYRHYILLIWVISNLAVSAYSNHRWYCTQFSSYPKGRAKLFPFIW